jgi:hypothetical protein
LLYSLSESDEQNAPEGEKGRRPVMKKAVAYTSDIVLGRTGEVIKRSYQADLIRKHAAENDIEIVAWFEDAMYNEDVMARPGVKSLLAFNEPYDMVLTERAWALSRSMGALETFFKELDRRGVTFESSTTMWDCVSQKCRRRFNPSLPAIKPERPVVSLNESESVHVKRPTQIRFANLVKRHTA